jgi:hypothetical protein
MGINNRDRRRQRKRRQAAAERARERRRAEATTMPGVGPYGHGHGHGHGERMEADDVERVLMRAVCAQRDRDGESVYELAGLLYDGPPGPGGQRLVDAVVARCARREVAAAVERGWEHEALARLIGRRLGNRHGRIPAILSEAPGGGFVDEVARRLRIGRSYAIHHVIEVLAFVLSLPPLPKLRSAERRERHGPVDGRMLERVRALLAKAESTTFPEEAEALSAKAQELMARYSIDRALLETTARFGADDVSGRLLLIDDPYAKEKSLLLGAVAGANRCKAVWSPDFGWSTVFGADDDLDIVDLLFTSLLCQATAAMAAAGSSADGDGSHARRARTRSFRQSFLVAYASRIGARLRQATETAADEAAETYGPERLLPVLAARSAAAEAAAHEAFPYLGRTRVSARDPAGWAAGAAAADGANLNVRREVQDTAG